MSKNPSAFPNAKRSEAEPGMSLRDYFAAAALPGLLGRAWDKEKMTDAEIIEQWGRSAYSVADAMLKAREND